MNDEWREVPLSDIAVRITQKNPDGLNRVLTVAASHGLVDQESYFTKRVASRNLANYTQVQPGDYVYNKSYSADAPLGVVARNKESEAGLVSPLYIVFRVDYHEVVPGFLDLAVLSPVFQESLGRYLKEGGRAHGALNVKIGEFFSAVIPLPPLVVQRRIVDLMEHLDTHLANLETEREAIAQLLEALRHSAFSSTQETRPMQDVLALIIDNRGKTPGKLGTTFTNIGVPVLSAINVKSNRLIPSPEPRFVDEAAYERWMKTPTKRGDILLTSEGPLGNVARIPDDRPWVIGQRLFALRCRGDLVLNDYLAHYLQSSLGQSALIERSSGSTVRGIRQSELLRLEVPLTCPDDQHALVARLNAAQAQEERIQQEIRAAMELRSGALGGLISGAVPVPATYDALLAVS